MKKLSVLIALALCLTIGGAYATWTYYTTVPSAVNGNVGVSIEASEVVAAGSLEVTTDDIALTVYDKGDYVAALKATDANSKIVVKFTAGAGIHTTDPAYTNGISIPVAIAVNGMANYNGSSPITVLVANFNILPAGSTASGNDLVWEGSNGTFTCEITAAKILSCVQVGDGNLTLDTIDKYNDFTKALKNNGDTFGDIKVTIGKVS